MNFDSLPEGRLEEIINKVAGIHAADINLYDLNGDLKVSSLPLPYKKGIVSEKMEPDCIFSFEQIKGCSVFPGATNRQP